MDKVVRSAIERATQQARKLLDDDFSAQLEGTFDVMRSGVVAPKGGVHLSVRQHHDREKIVAAIDHKRATGTTAPEAVTGYVRDAAFTTLNRFVALKMLEARNMVQECITKGEQSAGYKEFCGMAPGLALLPDARGYRLYIESLFDEFSTELKVLFDRRDAASILWPKRQTFDALLTILNTPELSGVWAEDETIGWVYQFFNSKEERQAMRDPNQGGSQAPRNSRELAVRNQFFTPRYVVQFLTDNTLGRTWYEMNGEETRLSSLCEYLVRPETTGEKLRQRKDPRDIRVLDPACGSGHFLLYSFDLLLTIYDEAWAVADGAPKSEVTGRALREDYPDIADLRFAAPKLIVEHNLHGVDIDPRCAQIAALALWLRAQRAWSELGIPASQRPRIQRTHIITAEPMPGERDLLDEFLRDLKEDRLEGLLRRSLDIPPGQAVRATKAMADSLVELVTVAWNSMRLAGEMGALLRIEREIEKAIEKGRNEWEDRLPLFRVTEYGLGGPTNEKLLRLIPGEEDDFWSRSEKLVLQALAEYAAAVPGKRSARRRMFAQDAAQGFALVDLVAKRFDVVLMNPPFGAGSLVAREEFDMSYPRTKNDVYAAFVERGIELLHPGGTLGALTSRTGFFLSSFQKWREEILLKEAPPMVFADLGFGVLDNAMVEVAAYCLEKVRGAAA